MKGADHDSGLRPAHADFAAHFTAAAYDPEHPDFEDDVPPFGSDEGWDEVYTWSRRADELLANPTLRYMVEDGRSGTADAYVVDLTTTEQVDVDDALIGMGFALLRYTGQIDAEGRVWLRDALTRQRDRDNGAGDHYQLLLDDLDSFEPELDHPSPARTSPREVARWVSITGSNDEAQTRWLRRIATSLNQDSTWTRWWSPIPFVRLGLYVVPVVPRGGREVYIDFDAERDPRHLQVIGATAALGESLIRAHCSGASDAGAWGTSEQTRALCTGLIREMLRETGTYSGARIPGDFPHPLQS